MSKSNAKSLWVDKKANTTMVSAAISLIILLSVLYIGLTIIDGVESGTALSTPWNETTQTGDRFYSTNADLTNTTGSAYTMAGIMPIVLIAVALLGAMLGLMFVFGKSG